MVISLLLAVALVVVDQLVKHWVVTTISLGASKTVLPGVLTLTNLHNTGAAWSMLSGQQGFFVLITVVALAIIGYLMVRWRHQRALMIGLALILAGTLGNFIDRLAHGYVVDMFETLFVSFPVFNVADSCLTIGVIILIIAILREDD
ncbi:signal peptidase II [Limosilactobacillus sp.]|uniref:signal peptidase II n=1 Tax=Limosilactobacillus sp. TaxID=2773925 RepID=UPI0025C03A3B|nr:signal peptidase II [Limosilactobacillus sp.]MCH3922927.1 signal peptidase II [Limosilactobacillus sp.]MCH3927610.1 signal peptidase II [Limosilactobacillus sp.]